MQEQGMYYTPSSLIFPENQSHASYLIASGLQPEVHFPPTSVSQNVYTAHSLTSVSTSSVADTNFSWAHTVPTYMPWAVQKKQGPVMRFTAPDPCTSQTATTWELLHNLGTTCTKSGHSLNQHLKRRSDSLEEETRPSKQYISEEKMAARMNRLHISNKHRTPEQKKIDTFELDEDKESDSDDLSSPKGRIEFAPELKELMDPCPMMLKALMNNAGKPSMALVLWKPPGGIVPEKIQQATQPSQHLPESSQSSSSSSSSSYSLMSIANSTPSPVFTEHNNNNTAMQNLNSLDETSRFEINMEETLMDMEL